MKKKAKNRLKRISKCCAEKAFRVYEANNTHKPEGWVCEGCDNWCVLQD